MQLGLISLASQACLLLCLCLFGCLTFLAPASPEKEAFLGCVPRLGSPLFSSCTELSPTLIHNVEGESQEGAWSDGGKRRRKRQSKHSGKREGGWENMVKDGKDFYSLSRESCCRQPLRRHFVYCPNQTNGKLSRSYLFPAIYIEYFQIFVLIKRCLYFIHILFLQ